MAYLFTAAAILLVMFGRLLSIDLTEGQALIEYWWIWLFAVICSLAAIYTASIGDKNE